MQMDSFGVEAGPLRGFPRVLQGPMAWEAQEYSGNPDKYVVHLSTSDVADIRNALATFQGTKALSSYPRLERRLD